MHSESSTIEPKQTARKGIWQASPFVSRDIYYLLNSSHVYPSNVGLAFKVRIFKLNAIVVISTNFLHSEAKAQNLNSKRSKTRTLQAHRRPKPNWRRSTSHLQWTANQRSRKNRLMLWRNTSLILRITCQAMVCPITEKNDLKGPMLVEIRRWGINSLYKKLYRWI